MCKILILPENVTIDASQGKILLDVLAENGYALPAACGGNGTCGKCRVKIVEGCVMGVQPDENGCVLACKAQLNGDITVEVNANRGGGLDEFKLNKVKTQGNGLGIALDVGTTTLAACLVELESGNIIKKTSCLNPQGVYGADVLSRIKACDEGKLSVLQKLIIDKTREMVNYLAEGKTVKQLAVSANTTMLHLFAGVDPSPIGKLPFEPVFKETQYFSGESLGLPVESVVLLPSASAYIGSDITSGVVACGIQNDMQTVLFVDIGTNGEMVLSHNGKLFGTSTAAGPALEGACIECGTGGVPGAIDKVFNQNGELKYSTVEKRDAVGICGSGLIDIIALLLREEIIDETGAWNEDSDSPLLKRLNDDKFYITENIYISQKDIRQFQLAKAAIRAGIETLFDDCKVSAQEISKVCIAGGLGFYMDTANAVTTGMFPAELKEKLTAVGNTGLSGAMLSLLNKESFNAIESVAESINVVDLGFSKVFQQLFVDNMMFWE